VAVSDLLFTGGSMHYGSMKHFYSMFSSMFCVGKGLAVQRSYLFLWRKVAIAIHRTHLAIPPGNNNYSVIAAILIAHCNLFRLSHDEHFQCAEVEVWGFIDKERTKLLELIKDKEGPVKSVLDNKENTYILDLLGKGYSAMVRD
jgi:hypothetical protein